LILVLLSKHYPVSHEITTDLSWQRRPNSACARTRKKWV
jgi:hypothetical protein